MAKIKKEVEAVEVLINRARISGNSKEALDYSQAALNSANALYIIEKQESLYIKNLFK